MHDLEFLNALSLDETTLSQVSQVLPKNLGQPEANKDAMSQLSQVVPSENNMKRAENNKPLARGEAGGQEIRSAAEPDFQAGYASGFLHCWYILFYAGVLVHAAQQAGQECNGCQHLIMSSERHSGSRRTFFWRCDLGYRQLETGHGGERIIIAPPECEAWEPWQPTR